MTRSWRVEVWQTQTYWAIKGWSSPLSGTPHYWSTLIPGTTSDTFPDNLYSPPGWTWQGDWYIDSQPYGRPDSDGWLYAASFERLHEQIKAGEAVGTSSKTSIVRKRCWVRILVCSSEKMEQQIARRERQIELIQSQISAAIEDKSNSCQSVGFYEENRAFVYAQSLHLSTQGTLNSLSVLKELISRLSLLQQFLHDRANIENEYAARIKWLSGKYTHKMRAKENVPEAAPAPQSQVSPLSSPQTTQSQSGSLTPFSPSVHPKAPTVNVSQTLPVSSLFFRQLESASLSHGSSISSFSANLCESLSEAIDGMLQELTESLSEARAVFKKNSDICRLSESTVKSLLENVFLTLESARTAVQHELALLSKELDGLAGKIPFSLMLFTNLSLASESLELSPPATPQSTSSSSSSSSISPAAPLSLSGAYPITPSLSSFSDEDQAQTLESSRFVRLPESNSEISIISASGVLHFTALKHPYDGYQSSGEQVANNFEKHQNQLYSLLLEAPRKDVWLSVHKYRHAVQQSQEALCVLITESLDLELRQQILANRVHNFFNAIAKSYMKEEHSLFQAVTAMWSETLQDFDSQVQAQGPPNAVLQSPFMRLQYSSKGRSGAGSTSTTPGAGSSEGSSVAVQLFPSIEEDEGHREVTSDDIYDNFMNSVGIFSFTSLYKELPPPCPGVVRTCDVLFMPVSQFMQLPTDIAKSVLALEPSPMASNETPASPAPSATSPSVFSPAYSESGDDGFDEQDIVSSQGGMRRGLLIATSDGYLHVLTHGKKLLPEFSFYLKQCNLNSHALVREYRQQGAALFDISYLPLVHKNAPASTASAGSLPRDNGSLVFKFSSRATCDTLLRDLLQLPFLPTYQSKTMERVAKEAMLESLPILRGETEKIDLELKKYEEMSVIASQEKKVLIEEGQESQEDLEENQDGEAEPSAEPDSETDPAGHLYLQPGAEYEDEGDAYGENAQDEEQEGESTGSSADDVLSPRQKYLKASVRSPAPSVLSGVKYAKKGEKGWETSDDHYSSSISLRRASGTAIKSPPAPKQLIPKVNEKVPLARRHSVMIKQYQQGIVAEKEKNFLKVNESKGERLKDFMSTKTVDMSKIQSQFSNAENTQTQG